jgi:hypothetical protein
MHSGLRTYLALALSLLLVLTGQTMALARSAAAPVGEMVLCTGTGPVTVQLDADGRPTDGTNHLCPDCALHFFTAVLPPAQDAVRVPRAVRPSSVREALASVVPVVRRPTARGPPA